MKGNILTTLTFVMCVTVSQCIANKGDLLELLRGLTSVDKKTDLKPIPPVSDNRMTKKASDSKACGKFADARRDESGSIDFPGADGYSAFLNCGWAIIGGPNSKVQVQFSFAHLENSRPCRDYIRVYSMKETSPVGNYEFYPLTDKLCPLQDMNPSSFSTNLDGIYIQFHSNWIVNGRGFMFDYQIEHSVSGDIVSGGSNDIDNLSCDFDSGSLCGWSNANDDALDWRVQIGSESPWPWGMTDHTTYDTSGAYAYLYTNLAQIKEGGKLISTILSAGPSGGRCLTFYYKLLVTDGAFMVILKYNDGGSQTVFQREGGQGLGWLKASVSLISRQPYSIEIEHVSGGAAVESGLAVDDIEVTDEPCPSQLKTCGTNMYESRKKRDLRSLFRSLIELEGKEKEFKNEEVEGRIIGGQASKQAQFPWIVQIRIFPNGVESGEYFQCGGSIINEVWIVSAAHCVEVGSSIFRRTVKDPAKLRILVGEHDTNAEVVEESQFVLIPERIVMHPDRHKDIFAMGMKKDRYDVILIQLKQKLIFSDAVNAVCLPQGPFLPGTNCVAAGWGVAEGGETSETLLYLNKTILSDDDEICEGITEDMICAIVPTGAGDVCQGDSGGPLACKRNNIYELAGAVSFGADCFGRERTPGVYADIFYFMPWIESTINAVWVKPKN